MSRSRRDRGPLGDPRSPRRSIHRTSTASRAWGCSLAATGWSRNAPRSWSTSSSRDAPMRQPISGPRSPTGTSRGSATGRLPAARSSRRRRRMDRAQPRERLVEPLEGDGGDAEPARQASSDRSAACMNPLAVGPRAAPRSDPCPATPRRREPPARPRRGSVAVVQLSASAGGIGANSRNWISRRSNGSSSCGWAASTSANTCSSSSPMSSSRSISAFASGGWPHPSHAGALGLFVQLVQQLVGRDHHRSDRRLVRSHRDDDLRRAHAHVTDVVLGRQRRAQRSRRRPGRELSGTASRRRARRASTMICGLDRTGVQRRPLLARRCWT